MNNGLIWVAAVAAIATFPLEAKAPAAAPPPIVSVPTPPLNETYSDWSVTRWGNLVFATTKNETGSAFGRICTTGCFYFINISKPCDDGDKYPSMINSDSGAVSVTMKCLVFKDKEGNRNLLTFEDDIDYVIRDSIRLGVAVPMASGQFYVARFSMSGARAATNRASSIGKVVSSGASTGLRDATY